MAPFFVLFCRQEKLDQKVEPLFLEYFCEREMGEKCGGMSSRWLIGLVPQLPNSIPPRFSVTKETTQKGNQCGEMCSVALTFSCKTKTNSILKIWLHPF